MKGMWKLVYTGVFSLALGSQAALVTYQNGVDGYAGTEDNGLLKVAPDKNYGTSTVFTAGTDRTPLLRFDITALDDGLAPGESIQVNSAHITLYQSYENAATRTVGLHQVSSANGGWIEGTGGDPAVAGGSCWNFLSYNTVSWAGSAGLQTPGVDYNAVAEDTVNIGNLAGFNQFDVSPSLVEAWIGGANDGVALVSTGIISVWASSESTTIANRPELTIDYAVVPEPSVLGLMSLTGILFIARRRLKK